MESTEAGSEEPCAPDRGAQHCKTAEDHKTDAHDWNCGHGKRAAGDDARAIEQSAMWLAAPIAGPSVKREGEKCAGDQWRKKSECNFAAGAGETGKPRRLAFQKIESSAMAKASRPSPSQTRSQAKAEGWRAANQAAPRAVRPRTTCPQPETAVNDAERSMVSRMKRRSPMGSASAARAGSGRVSRRKWRSRC